MNVGFTTNELLENAQSDEESVLILSLLKRVLIGREDYETASVLRQMENTARSVCDANRKRKSHRIETEEEALRQMKANGVNLTEAAQRRLDKYDRKPVTKKELDEGFKKFHDSLVCEYKEMTGKSWDWKTMGPK